MASLNSYTIEIPLILAIVFFVNSALLFFDHFLSSFLAITASLGSTALCFIAFSHFAKASESVASIFWSSFSLMSAHLSTSGDSSSWDLSRGRIFIALGFTVLALYAMFLWCRGFLSRPSYQPERVVERPRVPLPVEVSCHFIGNGIAIAARCLIPAGGSLVLVFVGSVAMLCFYVYCKADSVSIRDPTQQLHSE